MTTAIRRGVLALGFLVVLGSPLSARQISIMSGSTGTRDIETVILQKSTTTGDLSLTLRDAIELALEGNPILMVEKVRLEQTRQLVGEQLGNYDPVITLGERASHRDNIVASRFFPSGLYTDIEQSMNMGIQARTYDGGTLSLSMDYSRLESTSNVQTLSPQFTANMTFGFSQALLRDFGRSASTTGIRVAEKQGEIAEHNLFRTVTELVQQVEEMYWTLTFLRQDLEGKQRSLDIARELLVQNQELFDAGRVASVSVLQASAGVAEREEAVITAESEVARFEDRLKSLLWLDLSATNLTLVDPPPAAELAEINERTSFETALRQRPEILSLQREREQREIELGYADNQTRPRLDLDAQFTLSGLSGRPNETCLDPTSPICIPVGSEVAATVFADRTRPLDSVRSLFSNKPYEGWSVEMTFELPLNNRAAESRQATARLRLLETDTRLRALYDQVEEEIRNAIRDTDTARKRIDAARETITFLEDQLEGTQSQLDAGLASSYDVLQVLDELDNARTSELRAIMDFNVGLSRIRLADTSSLERYDIELDKPPRYEFE